MIKIGRQVKALRLKRRWSQSLLAHKVGTTQPHISEIEGDLRVPTLLMIWKLKREFKCDWEEILG